MSGADAVRASGETQADEVTKEESDALLEEIEIDAMPHLPEEGYQLHFRTPGFSRMRTDWNGPEGDVVRSVLRAIDDRIQHEFLDAYEIMNTLYELVRTPETDAQGDPIRDAHGFKVWKRRENGTWDEDWTRLTRAQKENVLFEITARLFSWEQRAANRWTEAMLAKGAWEEAFSLAYRIPQGRATIEDRTAAAKADSADTRYFAIFAAAYSRRAEAIVRTMALIGQRLKDSLAA